MALRARIVLNCGAGMSNSDVATKLQVTRATVGKWRERFRLERLEGLLDEPRPGAPRSITDEQVEDVVTRTLEIDAGSQHSLEHAADGAEGRIVSDGGGANLARLRVAAASGGEL
jgi:transposase